ncbi:hypothetical protein [Seleniivibrio sp.]|uniref:hypothetical protein n=1 Tax=Seleniivibrio sp. TaxID=2898801 RepID=UPI0025EE919D|nr:hypothetical protein [Seleniivibrio sp.]MCD8552297.1 hypothetical protein [Seleniivibrio sp.]
MKFRIIFIICLSIITTSCANNYTPKYFPTSQTKIDGYLKEINVTTAPEEKQMGKIVGLRDSKLDLIKESIQKTMDNSHTFNGNIKNLYTLDATIYTFYTPAAKVFMSFYPMQVFVPANQSQPTDVIIRYDIYDDFGTIYSLVVTSQGVGDSSCTSDCSEHFAVRNNISMFMDNFIAAIPEMEEYIEGSKPKKEQEKNFKSLIRIMPKNSR